MNSALFSSATPEWATPQWLFDALNARFQFDMDVCATPENAKCASYLTKEDDGLTLSWTGWRVWMNPPYGREIAWWVEKARREAEMGCLVVGLLPARIDARWWQEHVQGHADVRFIAGRLKFGDAKSAAPFPSAIAVWWATPAVFSAQPAWANSCAAALEARRRGVHGVHVQAVGQLLQKMQQVDVAREGRGWYTDQKMEKP